MRFLVDTSVLFAGIVEAHPEHAQSLAWLKWARTGPDIGIVAAHSLPELYAVLTTLPMRPRISAEMAQQLIRHDVLDAFKVVSLTSEEYAAAIQHLVDFRIIGGSVHDAIILSVALKAKVDQIITLNPQDFSRMYPSLADKITTP